MKNRVALLYRPDSEVSPDRYIPKGQVHGYDKYILCSSCDEQFVREALAELKRKRNSPLYKALEGK
jgi:hypothetical protein